METNFESKLKDFKTNIFDAVKNNSAIHTTKTAGQGMSSFATSASMGTTCRVQNLRVRDDLKRLGASNAMVYRGTATIDGTPNVPVAVKVFPPVVQDEPGKIIKEYNSQRQALDSASGQYICEAYGIVHDEKHKMCLVMKLYDGTIADELKKTPNAPLPLDRVLLVGLTVAQAICALHSSDEPRTYQDLKPENILLVNIKSDLPVIL